MYQFFLHAKIVNIISCDYSRSKKSKRDKKREKQKQAAALSFGLNEEVEEDEEEEPGMYEISYLYSSIHTDSTMYILLIDWLLIVFIDRLIG